MKLVALRSLLDGDLEAEGLEAAKWPVCLGVIVALEVVRAEIVVLHAVLEHVVTSGEE
jgi:hypothetical protein